VAAHHRQIRMVAARIPPSSSRARAAPAKSWWRGPCTWLPAQGRAVHQGALRRLAADADGERALSVTPRPSPARRRRSRAASKLAHTAPCCSTRREIPVEVQVKLLRVIQERVIERVGSGQPCPSTCGSSPPARATSKSSWPRAASVVTSTTGCRWSSCSCRPCASGVNDIPLLIDHFLALVSQRLKRPSAGFSREAVELLLAYDYPGNVRELEHVVESSCALCDGSRHGRGAAARRGARPAWPAPPSRSVLPAGRWPRPWTNFERSYLAHTLRELAGSRAELAERSASRARACGRSSRSTAGRRRRGL